MLVRVKYYRRNGFPTIRAKAQLPPNDSWYQPTHHLNLRGMQPCSALPRTDYLHQMFLVNGQLGDTYLSWENHVNWYLSPFD